MRVETSPQWSTGTSASLYIIHKIMIHNANYRTIVLGLIVLSTQVKLASDSYRSRYQDRAFIQHLYTSVSITSVTYTKKRPSRLILQLSRVNVLLTLNILLVSLVPRIAQHIGLQVNHKIPGIRPDINSCFQYGVLSVRCSLSSFSSASTVVT